MSEFDRPDPVVKVFHWEAVSGDPVLGGALEEEDDRELAFLDMAIRQLLDWDQARVQRVLSYLRGRFPEQGDEA